MLRNLMILRTFILLFSWILISNVATGEMQTLIDDRKTMFKKSKKNMKTLRNSIRNQNIELAGTAITFHISWSQKLESYFPIGSEASMSNESDASGDIWTNLEQFKRLNENYLDKSLKVKAKLDEKNLKGAKSAFSEMAKTCKACHAKFRN